MLSVNVLRRANGFTVIRKLSRIETDYFISTS